MDEIRELYIKVLDSLELLGWEEVHVGMDGFAVYSRALGDEEFILNIDPRTVVVRGKDSVSNYVSPEMVYLKKEIKSLLIWHMLQRAIREKEAA